MHEKLDVVFLEEPLFSEDHAGLSKLASTVDIPIAGGENERRIHRFRHLMEKGCFDIVQPDVVYTGILNGRKIEAWQKPITDCAYLIPGTVEDSGYSQTYS